MTARRQLEASMRNYSPEVAAVARGALARLRKRLAGAVELVYDNYNALVIAYGPSERASEVVCSIALYPRWVNLFFLYGASLPDPDGILRGSGRQVRSVRLESAKTLDEPAVRELLSQALARADPPIDRSLRRRSVIRAVSAKQRARRP